MADLRWGLTLPFPGLGLADHEPLVRQAEADGYDDLWTGETTGPDGFTPLALAAAWTERMRLGTGVVNPFTRGPRSSPSTRPRSRTRAAGASASGSGPPRT